jgi:hypothetical protein
MMMLVACEQAPKAKPAPVTEDWKRDVKTQGFVDRKRITVLQHEATKACLCARAQGNKTKAECWDGFWKEVNEYRHTSTASACGPGSSEFVDFEDFSGADTSHGDQSVITEWGYGACSSDEILAKKAEYEREAGRQGC